MGSPKNAPGRAAIDVPSATRRYSSLQVDYFRETSQYCLDESFSLWTRPLFYTYLCFLLICRHTIRCPCCVLLAVLCPQGEDGLGSIACRYFFHHGDFIHYFHRALSPLHCGPFSPVEVFGCRPICHSADVVPLWVRGYTIGDSLILSKTVVGWCGVTWRVGVYAFGMPGQVNCSLLPGWLELAQLAGPPIYFLVVCICLQHARSSKLQFTSWLVWTGPVSGPAYLLPGCVYMPSACQVK